VAGGGRVASTRDGLRQCRAPCKAAGPRRPGGGARLDKSVWGRQSSQVGEPHSCAMDLWPVHGSQSDVAVSDGQVGLAHLGRAHEEHVDGEHGFTILPRRDRRSSENAAPPPQRAARWPPKGAIEVVGATACNSCPCCCGDCRRERQSYQTEAKVRYTLLGPPVHSATKAGHLYE